MKYKTIVLELLKDRPETYNRLRKTRMLASVLELYSSALKTNHEAWKERLLKAIPGSEESQISSEALEISLKDLEDSLDTGIPPENSEDLFIVTVSNHRKPA